MLFHLLFLFWFKFVWFDYIFCWHYYRVLFNFHLHSKLKFGFRNYFLLFSLLICLFLYLFKRRPIVFFGIIFVWRWHVLKFWTGKLKYFLVTIFLLWSAPLVAFQMVKCAGLNLGSIRFDQGVLHPFFYHKLYPLHFVHCTFLVNLFRLLNFSGCEDIWFWILGYFEIVLGWAVLGIFVLTRVLRILAFLIRLICSIWNRVFIIIIYGGVGKLR